MRAIRGRYEVTASVAFSDEQKFRLSTSSSSVHSFLLVHCAPYQYTLSTISYSIPSQKADNAHVLLRSCECPCTPVTIYSQAARMPVLSLEMP
ncbi:hypothetical protein EVAR_81389_1 [Eumeta japonica]|uniref:Uncharacterized protein n=1 Tax=Eumeta variegata TaxID=151549 RepID=A0A4C1WG03_EUMVA|nr:hypothetical protein EVAR_81389_1 [Eumeta japonica]